MAFDKMTKKLKEVVTGQKEEGMTPAEEKMRVAQIREASELLKAKLMQVRLVDPRGNISKEELLNMGAQLKALCARLESSQASFLDTRSLDKKMMFFADHLSVAIRDGRKETANHIMKGLLYGIGKGHAPIPLSDSDKMDQIMEDRENRLSQYRTIVEYSMKIDDRQKSIDQQREKFNELKEVYQVKRTELDKERTENPHLVEKINTYGAKRKEELDPDAFALASRMEQVVNVFNNMKQLKQLMSLNEVSINSCRDIIDSEENALTQMGQKIEQDLIDEVIKHEAEFRKNLVGLQEQIGELEELSDRFKHDLDAIFSSPFMAEYTIKASKEYDSILKKEEIERRAREEGRKLQLEREREQQQEIEHGMLLNN